CCLPPPPRAPQQQACLGSHGIIASKRLNNELGLLEAAVPRCGFACGVVKVGVEVVEIAVLVAAREARATQSPRGSVAASAVAGDGPHASLFAGLGDGLLPGNAFRFFILRDALDGFPSCTAA